MAELQQKLENDLRAAMKARAELTVSTLRLLKSDIQYELTKTGAKDMPDADVEAALKRAIKRRRDSIEQYEQAGRKELADKERAEAEILEAYLPPSLTEDEIAALADEVIQATGASAPSDTGKVMGPLMGKLKATGKTVDGAVVKTVVQKKLSG